MKSRKIIQIIPYIDSRYGGPPYVAKSLDKLLANSELLTLGCEENGSGIIFFKTTTTTFWFSFDFMKNSIKYVQKSDVVFIHGVYTFPSLWGSLISFILGKKVFLFPHGMLDSNSIESSSILKNMLRKLYLYTIGLLQAKTSEHIIFNSFKEMDNSLFKDYGIVVPNGVDLKKIDNINCKNYLFSKDKVSLFFLGRINKIKGIELIIDAINSLDQNTKDKIELVIAGTSDKEYLDQVQKKIDNKIVKFIGHIETDIKYCYLRQCDIYLQPSMTEGLSISMLEAMACKANIITTNRVGLHKELKECNAAKIIDYDVNDLKQAIVDFVDNDVNYGDRAYNLVSKKYNWKGIKQSYIKILESI